MVHNVDLFRSSVTYAPRFERVGLGEMQTQSPARARDTAAPIGSDELAEGLMLVRASTLKMIRLQLAMERRDRRVALEAVDDLVALDRKLEDYLGQVPSAQLMFRHELEAERTALNREKLTLAAGVIHGRTSVAEPEPPAEEVAATADQWQEFEFQAEPQRRISWWLVAVLILVSAIAGATYWLAGPNVLERLFSGAVA